MCYVDFCVWLVYMRGFWLASACSVSSPTHPHVHTHTLTPACHRLRNPGAGSGASAVVAEDPSDERWPAPGDASTQRLKGADCHVGNRRQRH
jgi:hypothetical protein